MSKPKLFWKENPFGAPCFPDRKQAEELYCGFYTEAAIIQKHKFEIIQRLFHNPSNLLNPPTNLILSFKNVSAKKNYFVSIKNL